MTQSLLVSKLKRARYMLAFLCLFCTDHLYAQSFVVSGAVKDDSGLAIPGVNVLVKGTATGTVTDADGKYSLEVPSPEATLVFSFIGYLGQEVNVGQRTTVDIQMVADITTLGEVVVVGYGTQEKVNVTGSVGSVKFDDKMSSRALSNVSSGLSGLIPGLTATQASGMAGNSNATLLIRGMGSVNNSSPLIVVDGVPDVDINLINFNDIESVSVLKDAASASIYGSRGANGVILVTTKSGKGKTKTVINYNGSLAIQKPTSAYNYMADYPRALTLHQRAAAVNTLPSGYIFKNGTIDEWMAKGMIDPLAYPNTDWWDVIMRDGSIANHTISATGGSDKSNFFISAGIMDQKGLQINNDYSRYNMRLNYDYKLHSNMNIGMKLSGNWSKYTYSLPEGFTESLADNTAGEDLQYAIAGITPYDPVSGYYGGIMAYGEAAQAYNPYTQYVNRVNYQNRQEVNPNVYFDWTPIKGLTARVDYSLNYYNQFRYNADIPNRAYNFQTKTFGTRIYVADNAGISNATNTGYKTQLNGRINYITTFASNHELGVLLAYSEEYWFDRFQFSSRTDRLHPSLHEVDAALSGTQVAGGNSSSEGLRSYIGRLNYSAYDKYLLEVSFRYDGSSRFLAGNRYGFFPAISAGWRFTEENFLQNVNWLSRGKLRASYGSLGNIYGVGRFEQRRTLATGHYMVDGNIAKGFVDRKLLNEDLSWEETRVLDIGLELGLLNDRLSVEFDYYDRLTTGMILGTQLSTMLSGAYDAPRQNIGDLRNRGVELTLSWRSKIGQVNYFITANGSYNANTIENWSGFLARGATNSGNFVFEDMPYNYVYTYVDRGIAQTWQDVYNATPQGASPGDILRNDLNGDGRIDANDKKAFPRISRDRPTTNYGINIGLSWKGFDISALLQGAAGRKDHWLNIYNNVNPGTTRYAFTEEHWNNPWSVENRNGSWPRMSGNANREETTFWLDNFNYLRMKNLQIGYTVSPDLLNKVKVNSFRIYGSAENLFTITKYRGLDPEKTGSRSDAYPINKSYSLGINIGI
jgi:TonB-linked SusC/RagA family outer membrane protein